MTSPTTEIDAKALPGLMRVFKTLANGERASYLYHRPTMRRLHSEPGTSAFALEYAEAIKRGPKRKGRGGFKPVAGQVYLVRAETLGLIKIGRTANVPRRMNALRVASPDRLTVLAVLDDPAGMLERELHIRFAPDRRHGEWFQPSQALEDFIRSVA